MDSEYSGKKATEKIAVIGLGASGEAAVRLALAKGAEVHVSDASNDPAVADRGAGLRDLGARVELGGHALAPLVSADTVVASPGIPPDSPVLSALRARGVRWISEPDFACRFLSSPLIVVTGTNGKTTTAALAAHLLAGAGLTAALGGNVSGAMAAPASALAALEPPPDRIVLELSSFQLAETRRLRPAVGVMTNLASDHLDRYGSLEAYYRDKRRLFELGGDSTTWVLNADDPRVLEMSRDAPGKRLAFSLERPSRPGAWLSGRDFVMDLEGSERQPSGGQSERIAGVDDLQLAGGHNQANALAALLAAAAAGADPGIAAAALSTFAPLPHRLEPVGTIGGVRWINDSKATNVAAARSALAAMKGPLALLLGGQDKGEDFRELVPALRDKARVVLAYGAAAERAAKQIGPAAGGDVEVRVVRGGFEEVVAEGQALARAGETLLLSPACASFDMFANYEVRGDAFRALAGRMSQ